MDLTMLGNYVSVSRVRVTGSCLNGLKAQLMSGGQGLWSTVDVYLTFAQMFLNAGTVNDFRLLRPETFKRMVTNCLSENQQTSARSILDTSHGFGLGVAMVLDPLKAGPQPCGGGMGAVGWHIRRLVASRSEQ
jgi:hypothetical protein